MQEGLRAAYTSLANNLGRRGIMHVQAEAGLFVMLDLREFLEDSTKVRLASWLFPSSSLKRRGRSCVDVQYA